ncbi:MULTISPECIES: hypothetical protein [Acidianus]|uniref:VTT domain-containing protein n=1 Tax=Candidatus Acidianus copahuensis TaxID=1160895 RepID=A0A031LLS4_9CREN|nr:MULTISPECIES: hypothetical protein [Acidianus]EZQ01813.1 hypothetical protein CM19_12125 [Candidatus Acidianus copahuensis]NON62824.1 hypothetical protein [Acidianus sp. RZ1]
MNLYYIIIIFAISVGTNAIPFFGTPYTLVASTLVIKSGINLINIIEAIAVTAIGAAIAKVFMYAVGYGVEKRIKTNKNISFFMKLVKGKPFYIALFILALLPLVPLDDFAFLVGGTAKAPLFRMFKITIGAKIIKSSIEIPIEVFGLIKVAEAIGVSAFELGIISSISFTVLFIIAYKLDWEEIYEKAKKYLNFGPFKSL